MCDSKIGFLCCVIVFFAQAVAMASCDAESKNFLVRNVLEDGEVETRINLNGVSAKEVSVDSGDGLRFRQLTDGRHFIQLIYDGRGILQDCEFLRDPSTVHHFLHAFRKDIRDITATRNATVISGLRARSLPADIKPWLLHYRKLRRECARRHRDIQRHLRTDNENEVDDTKVEHGNSSARTRPSQRRQKRSLARYFMMPGTLWCGYSHIASKYTHLGIMSATDQCCRRHDHCPLYIPGFGQRFGNFNRRPFTMSLCSCDMSFRTCLKMVGSSDANIVGKVFFNIVQTKCFVFKPKKTCVQRSWWGKCLKSKHKRQAVLRDNMNY